MKDSKYDSFEGEVLRGRDAYEIVDEIQGFTELRGFLAPYENKKVHITIEIL